jgi:hypothetical protein
MSDAPNEFYSEERWQNWIDRIKDEEIDPEDEDSARLLLNLQDDAAIAVAKIVSAHEDGELDEDAALDEIGDIRDIVLSEVEFADEEKVMLIDGVQTSLMCVFFAAEEYIRAAADAEAEEDFDAALGYVAQAGTLIIDGKELDMEVAEELEYGLVTEWVNGLDSLQSAMSDPEVVEEEDDEE